MHRGLEQGVGFCLIKMIVKYMIDCAYRGLHGASLVGSRAF